MVSLSDDRQADIIDAFDTAISTTSSFLDDF